MYIYIYIQTYIYIFSDIFRHIYVHRQAPVGCVPRIGAPVCGQRMINPIIGALPYSLDTAIWWHTACPWPASARLWTKPFRNLMVNCWYMGCEIMVYIGILVYDIHISSPSSISVIWLRTPQQISAPKDETSSAGKLRRWWGVTILVHDIMLNHSWSGWWFQTCVIFHSTWDVFHIFQDVYCTTIHGCMFNSSVDMINVITIWLFVTVRHGKSQCD